MLHIKKDKICAIIRSKSIDTTDHRAANNVAIVFGAHERYFSLVEDTTLLEALMSDLIGTL